ncbi:hypothetical protein PCORN_04158 [Listeria cornellensis FSL F6-0969]|uniref:Uncharacterized protein n=1 Tax=Listeria cornellensis FSL F6-0969 TaxID=1265820 RepID=W7CFS5_9LIST|nr:hypothetical protein PCORN_04158 [Listeria cornellensis FSL F6-0969]
MITVSQLFWFVLVALVSHVFDFIPKSKGRAWITMLVLALRIYWAIFFARNGCSGDGYLGCF